MPAPPEPGWVYILTNEAMPGLVKIGLTTKTPTERAAELSSVSGVPLPFEVAWARTVTDCAYVEKTVHRLLADKRINKKRESFRVSVQEGRQVIESTAGALLGRQWQPPPAPTKRPTKGRGRRRRHNYTPALLVLSAAVLITVLVFVRPSLPSWLPTPVLQGFIWVETWRSSRIMEAAFGRDFDY